MRRKVVVMIYARQRPWPALQRLFAGAGCPRLAERGPSLLGFYDATLAEDAPELARLRAALAEAGITWSERREIAYTTAELRAAPLLRLIVRSAEQGRGRPTYGTRYDLLRACPRCGTGALQISPLVLDPAEIPKSGAIFQTLDHEVLVSPALGQALQETGVSGLTLGHAVSATGVTLPWLQILSAGELPPMDPATTGIIRGTGPDSPCPRCGRDGYFGIPKEPAQIVYHTGRVNPDALPDVVHTYERFGLSRLREPFAQSHFANPLLLVKPKVYDVFKQQKVRRVEFHPARLVDS